MANLTRYDIMQECQDDWAWMEKCSDGEYVKFDDVKEFLKPAHNIAIAQIGERLAKYNREFDMGNLSKDDFVERISEIAHQHRNS